MHITAVILTKNEELKLERAIRSVQFCKEILVLDDHSTDRTAAVAAGLGAVVIPYHVGENFAQARNFAMDRAHNEWVLFLDADEIISKELAHEIAHLDSNTDAFSTAWALPRRDFFWGHELRFGETAAARKRGIIRLVKRGNGRWIGRVHEVFVQFGRVGKLNGYIDHYPHDTVSAFIHDINTYSSLRAAELYDTQRAVSTLEMVFVPFFKFIYTYFILMGFRDGAPGFIYSFVMAFHSFLVRSKAITLYD